ncbi:MAG: hypothetical protein GX321_02765 [Clostridiales bacterium]|nr:hypothetical protein [Clostridiales bacterium]
MYKNIFIIILISLISLTGCNKTDNDIIEIDSYERINFSNPVNNPFVFTVSKSGDIFLLEINGNLKHFSIEGNLIKEYADSRDFTALCCDNNELYVYDAVKSQIVCLNIENGERKTITESLKVYEMQKLIKIDNDLYALGISNINDNVVTDKHDLVNFDLKLYKINIKTGKYEILEEDNIMSIYATTDGGMYYYGYRDGEYGIYSYNTKNGKSTKVYDMIETDIVNAFVYENDCLVYFDMQNSSIKALRLSDGKEDIVEENIVIAYGSNMSFVKGNVVYCGLRTYGSPNNISSIYIEDLFTDKQTTESQQVTTKPEVQNKGTITVYSILNRNYINTDIIKEKYGIRTKLIEQTVYDEVLITEIMAGNSDIDVYITYYGGPVSMGVRDKNIFVPLNDSEPIKKYKDKCFDYIADTMLTPSGDIWMLPISLNCSAIWYIPENIEKHSIDLEEFQTLDSFLSLSERMKKAGPLPAYVEPSGGFAFTCLKQYDLFYNDYSNKKVNYETPLYKELFDKLWSGWVYYSQESCHPLFRDSMEDYKGEMIWESLPYDKSKLIYKWSYIGNHIKTRNVTFEGWRALPTPRISSDVTNNVLSMRCAFINPYSENKELALEYLEAIADVSHDYMTSSAVFLFEDKLMYKDHYDITQPGFEDVYNIYQNGVLDDYQYVLNNTIVDDYQNGRLTLDEAVAAIQREAEMWLNE